MVNLDTKLELAQWLQGGAGEGRTLGGGTSTIKGTVVADSADGTVQVMVGEPDGSTTAADLTAELPIIGSASTGDEVTIIVQDGIPTAIAAPGWGDNIKADLQYMTFEPSGTYPGLHIHENATNYNLNGDLWLNSGAIELRDNGSMIAEFAGDSVQVLGGRAVFGASTPHLLTIGADDADVSVGAYENGTIGGEIYLSQPIYNSNQKGSIVLRNSQASGQDYDDSINAWLRVVLFNELCDNNGNPGTNGQVLTSQGSGQPPIWSTPQGGGAVTTWYGSSSTAAGTQTKDVTCADFVLEKGAIITVYFTNANTYGALKLNVNSTGAIAVYHRGAATSSSNVVSWNKKDYVTFQYDGTYWVFISSSGSRVISSKDRLTSANVGTNGTGGLNHLICKATTMTTGTPASDGHIIDLDWDANYSQHAQLFLPCVDNQFPQWRMQVNNAWTAWDTFYTAANPPTGVVMPFCHAVNTSATSSVGSTVKNVTLHSIDIQSGNGSAFFEISDGGIKCKQAGKIEVNGSCYFGTATASWSRGVYLLKGSTEIGTSGYGSGYSTAVMACQAVTTVAAGDIIYLAARSSSSNTVAVNYATNLSIKYLEI